MTTESATVLPLKAKPATPVGDAVETALAHLRQANAVNDLIYCLAIQRDGTGLEALDGDTIQLAVSTIAAELSAALEALEAVQP